MYVYRKKVYFKDKFNRAHGPCEMTKHKHKHYTMTYKGMYHGEEFKQIVTRLDFPL